MPRMYCSHVLPLMFKLSPLVVSPEILVAKGGTLWAKNGRWILPEMPDFHVAFRNLLHAVNLRHGTDGFTSPPKEDVLRIFFALKNPRTWVPKASTLPLDHRSRCVSPYTLVSFKQKKYLHLTNSRPNLYLHFCGQIIKIVRDRAKCC